MTGPNQLKTFSETILKGRARKGQTTIASLFNTVPETSNDLFASQIISEYHGRGCPCCQGLVKGQRLKVDWAPAEFGTVQQLADQLTSGFNGWASSGDDYKMYWNLGSSGTYPKNGTLTFNVAGTNNQYTDESGNLVAADTNGITDTDYLDQIREAFKLLELSTGITFTEVTGDSADIDFTDNQSGAYAETIQNLGSGTVY